MKYNLTVESYNTKKASVTYIIYLSGDIISITPTFNLAKLSNLIPVFTDNDKDPPLTNLGTHSDEVNCHLMRYRDLRFKLKLLSILNIRNDPCSL